MLFRSTKEFCCRYIEWLAWLIVEARWADRNPYPPTYIQHAIACIIGLYSDRNYPNFMDWKRLQRTDRCFGSLVSRASSSGHWKSCKVCCCFFSQLEERQLWNSGVIGDQGPVAHVWRWSTNTYTVFLLFWHSKPKWEAAWLGSTRSDSDVFDLFC